MGSSSLDSTSIGMGSSLLSSSFGMYASSESAFFLEGVDVFFWGVGVDVFWGVGVDVFWGVGVDVFWGVAIEAAFCGVTTLDEVIFWGVARTQEDCDAASTNSIFSFVLSIHSVSPSSYLRITVHVNTLLDSHLVSLLLPYRSRVPLCILSVMGK